MLTNNNKFSNKLESDNEIKDNGQSNVVARWEGEQLQKLREEAIKEVKEKKHEWRQRGSWLVCKSCKFRHASWIGREKMLIGINKRGKPVLKDRQSF